MITTARQIGLWGGRAIKLEEEGCDDAFLWGTAIRSLTEVTRFKFPPGGAPNARAVHAVLLASNRVNAVATVCREDSGEIVDLIGMNAGTVYSLSIVLLKLLSLDGVLSDLKKKEEGYPSVEGKPVLEEGSAVFALLKLGLDFVMRHELAHLVNGHVDLLSQVRNVQSLSEEDSFAPEQVDIFRYTLEYDADCSAVVTTCECGLESVRKGHFDKTRMHPMLVGACRIHASELEFAYYFGFVLFVFFSLSMKNFSSPYGGKSHPAAHVRMMWAVTTVSTLELAGRLPMSFSDECMRGCIDAFEATATTRGEPFPSAQIEASLAQSTGHLHESIKAEWARIHPLLEPLARAGKLAPADPDA